MNVLLETKADLEHIFKSAHLNFPGVSRIKSNDKEMEFTFAEQSNCRGRLIYVRANGNNQEKLLIWLPTYEQPKTFPVEIAIIRLNKNTFRITSTFSAEKLSRVPETFWRFWSQRILFGYFISTKRFNGAG
jgi:hypothetical protein